MVNLPSYLHRPLVGIPPAAMLCSCYLNCHFYFLGHLSPWAQSVQQIVPRSFVMVSAVLPDLPGWATVKFSNFLQWAKQDTAYSVLPLLSVSQYQAWLEQWGPGCWCQTCGITGAWRRTERSWQRLSKHMIREKAWSVQLTALQDFRHGLPNRRGAVTSVTPQGPSRMLALTKEVAFLYCFKTTAEYLLYFSSCMNTSDSNVSDLLLARTER